MRHDNLEHRRLRPEPWVKVGTTTIDGSLVDIANILDVASWPIDWDRDAEASIDLFMRADEPWLIGGRHLRGRSSHVNASRGTALIRCDVVRRQSEIDAERQTGLADGECRSCGKFDALSTMGTCSPCCYRAEAPCPECGPHGNRGKVPGLDAVYDCTTCAGGKPGDLWGEVKPSEEPKYWSSVANKMVTFAEALSIGRSLRRPEDEMTAEPISAGATITNIPSITPLHKPPPSFMDARREALVAHLVQMRLHGFGCGEFIAVDTSVDERTS